MERRHTLHNLKALKTSTELTNIYELLGWVRLNWMANYNQASTRYTPRAAPLGCCRTRDVNFNMNREHHGTSFVRNTHGTSWLFMKLMYPLRGTSRFNDL